MANTTPKKYALIFAIGSATGLAASVALSALTSHAAQGRSQLLEVPHDPGSLQVATGSAPPHSAAHPRRTRPSAPVAELDPNDEVAREDHARDIPPPEELDRQNDVKFRGLLANHDAAPRNRDWAFSAEQAFAKKLTEVSGGEFTITGVDCRSSSCVAQVEWPSYAVALASYWNVLHFPALPCKTTTFLPAPADPDAKYQGRALFFDCKPPRAND